MAGSIRRKRAHSDAAEDGNGKEMAAEGILATRSTNTAGAAAKRRRVAAAAASPSGRQKENVAVGAAAGAAAETRTPQTPRTIHAVTSAITGALKHGGLAPRMFAALLPERRTDNELDKLYDVDSLYSEPVGGAASEQVAGSDTEDELLAATPTKSTRSTKATKAKKALRFPPRAPMPQETVQSDAETGITPENEEEPEEMEEEDNSTVRTPRQTIKTATAAAETPTSGRRKRDPLGNLAIDGTDRLKSGLELNLARGSRHRTMPAKYRGGVEVGRGSGGGTPLRARGGEKAEGAEKAGQSSGRARAERPAAKRKDDTPRATKTTTPAKQAKPAGGAGPTAATKGVEAEEAAEAVQEEEPEAGVEEEEDDDDDGDDDDEVCVLCGKPDSKPPNEIVFCEGCDMAVHQLCYNVSVIPEGDWFCKACVQKAKAMRAAQTTRDAQGMQDAAQAAQDAQDAQAVAPHDLAPDIPNFAHHLGRMKQVLMGRCTGRLRVALQGQDEAYEKTYQLVEQTVAAGEGNSMLVIGARGTGKTTMIEAILHDLAGKHKAAFHVVRLNGFIHTDDKLALRAIWRQLGKEMAVEEDVVSKTNNYADTMASLLALLSHPSEMAAGAEAGGGEAGAAAAEADAALTSTSVVFVLDEFDRFATHARQTLLYNLLDIAQARKAPIAVLGVTTRVDVVESLEKRVKSRFSHRYVYLSLPRSLPAYWDVCRLGLVVDDGDETAPMGPTDPAAMDVDADADADQRLEGAEAFRKWWQHMVDMVKDEPAFQEQLAFHFYSSKSVAAFWTTCLPALAAVSPSAPRLQLPPVGSALGVGVRLGGGGGGGVACVPRLAPPSLSLSLQPPDCKLHLLAALSELELALLVAAARLDIVLSTDTVNFAMAYDEYVSLMGKHHLAASASGSVLVAGGARVWGRGVATRAWERLASLGLLIPTGHSGGIGISGGGAGGVEGQRRGRGRPPGDGAAGGSGLEGRSMWRTEVALEEIPAAPGVRLGAVLARWCKEI